MTEIINYDLIIIENYPDLTHSVKKNWLSMVVYIYYFYKFLLNQRKIASWWWIFTKRVRRQWTGQTFHAENKHLPDFIWLLICCRGVVRSWVVVHAASRAVLACSREPGSFLRPKQTSRRKRNILQYYSVSKANGKRGNYALIKTL